MICPTPDRSRAPEHNIRHGWRMRVRLGVAVALAGAIVPGPAQGQSPGPDSSAQPSAQPDTQSSAGSSAGSGAAKGAAGADAAPAPAPVAPAAPASAGSAAAAEAVSAVAAAEAAVTTVAQGQSAPQHHIDPGPLAVLGALVPGLLIQGTGHRIAGDSSTANRLLLIEGIGVGTLLAGGIPLAATGASGRIATYTIPLIVAGAGTFLLGWAADIYGAAGGPHIAGTPQRRVPMFNSQAGYLYVSDRQFAYNHFADLALGLRLGEWRLGTAAQIALDDDNQRVRAEVDYRFFGPQSRRSVAPDGTALDVQAATTVHRYGSDGFTLITVEASAAGRYDLVRLSPSLAGSFAEMSFGLGLEIPGYDSIDAEPVDLLLGGFAFGVYLGTPGSIYGEVRGFYNHRRDDLVGGLSGFSGSFGIDGLLVAADSWGVSMSAEVGAVSALGVSLLYRKL